ncbi:chaperone NapD [Ponticoccus litoralis]|uniref:Chaperone NapD n=1 Tax=Ponticoccus litoralis TaxID=422297 RepID=A0AAW9SWH4_9RHOB
MNICGCLVHVARDDLAQARSAMEAMAGVEVHAQTEDATPRRRGRGYRGRLRL